VISCGSAIRPTGCFCLAFPIHLSRLLPSASLFSLRQERQRCYGSYWVHIAAQPAELVEGAFGFRIEIDKHIALQHARLQSTDAGSSTVNSASMGP
jgi:hypothetical protein